MSLDKRFINFYNNIKSDKWPRVESWKDLNSLPKDIKYNLEKFNPKHVFDNKDTGILACVKDEFAFIPVTKCASTHYINLFTNHCGWDYKGISSEEVKELNCVGLLMDPLQRWTKGVTEWIWWYYFKTDSINLLEEAIDTPFVRHVAETAIISDDHTSSYHDIYGKDIKNISWIPMDILTKEEINQSLINYFKTFGRNVDLPLVKQIHTSSELKLKLHKFVESCFYDLNYNNRFYRLTNIYQQDLELFYDLVKNFTIDWQHI